MNTLVKLNALGQSIWFDNIERNMLGKGKLLERLIEEDDLRGITSNPAIYEKAISLTDDYDQAIMALKDRGLTPRELFFELAIDDVQNACDTFLPVYQKTDGLDGYVSLEVSPDLAHDVDGTVKEALNLWSKLHRQNAMIKVPATIEGIEAITILVAEGININVTLIFSIERYLQVVEAYISGLEKRVEKGLSIENIASVASFFISRIDSKVDPLVSDQCAKLKGKIAIANAKKAYQSYLKLFKKNERFKKLEDKGARVQRLLWASTGVKDPDYSETLYIDELIGEETVNTIPPQTYYSYKKLGNPALRIMKDHEEVGNILVMLKEQDISLSDICHKLEMEGIAQFEKAFSSLLSVIERKLK